MSHQKKGEQKKQEEEERRRKLNSPEYKAEQELKKEYDEYIKKYGEPEEDRSQALEIRSHFEYDVHRATLNILRKLGHYPNLQYELEKSLLRQSGYALSSKQTWSEIDRNCIEIEKLTGVKLRINKEIWQFEKNELEKYVEQLRLKESIVGKLIEISNSTINSNNNAHPGVYLIVNNKTHDFYVGESQNMNFRRKTHLGELVDQCHHSKLMQEHFNQYGKNTFDFYVLEQDRMHEVNVRRYAEERWIREYKPTYNSNI